MRGFTVVIGLLLVGAAFGCGSDSPTDDSDAGKRKDAGAKPSTDDPCTTDEACSDDNFCNGAETCSPESKDADARGCVKAAKEPCSAEQTCNEKAAKCVGACMDDADGDGHLSMDCGGDDCDDTLETGPNRFPGNPEICDDIDQDCDPLTIGYTDDDGDESIDDACCNTDDADGTVHCGGDCNDDNVAQRKGQPEFCDKIDNDCDGKVDNNTAAIAWYEDQDGDQFGSANGDVPVMSCNVVVKASPLNTDCDDADAVTHPGLPDVCDDFDNNCNGLRDENATGTCATAPAKGTALPIDECLNGLDTCMDAESCVDDADGFSCLNATDPCADNGGCDTSPMAACEATTSGRTCTCPDGSSGIGVGSTGCVVDTVDSCLTDNGGCYPGAVCTDDAGSPSCECPAYSMGSGFGASGCKDVNECLTNNGGCGTLLAATCANNDFSPVTCTDVNECLVNNGGCGSATYYTCSDTTPGSARTCTPVDQCAANNGGCGNATYYACDDSTAGVLRTCSPINQCATNNGGCPSNKLCVEVPGSPPTCENLVLCNSSYTVSTQAQLNALAALGCTQITGDLTISNSSDIVSLAGLESVRLVDGNVLINSAVLTSLAGLNQLGSVGGSVSLGRDNYNPKLLDVALTGLRTVGGNLTVQYNDKLADLAGLAGVTRIEGQLIVRYNAALTTATLPAVTRVGGALTLTNAALTTVALNALADVGGTLTVAGNALLTAVSFPALTQAGGLDFQGNVKLASLGNLGALSVVSGAVTISNNPVLTNISTLNGLTSVTGTLTIQGNAELPSISLLSITSIGGSLDIFSNPKLTSISGFAGITDMQGRVEIRDNALLTSISGFGSLATINTDLSIHDNPALTQITGFAGLTTVTGTFRIKYNPVLTQFNSIAKLAYVGDDLIVEGNLLLNSIAGLGSGTLDYVGNRTMVRLNPALSACEVADAKAQLATLGGGDLNAGNKGCTACTGAVCTGTAGGLPGQSTILGPSDVLADNSFTWSASAPLGLLANVTVIKGNLTASNMPTSLTSLNGLNNLVTIGGTFTISSNSALTNVTGLSALTTVGNLTIQSNGVLSNVNGLSALTTVGGTLDIQSNAALTNVNGLSALTTVGGTLDIQSNPALTNVNGLSALTTIGGAGNSHYITGNSALSNLNGLTSTLTGSLTTVGGNIYLVSNGFSDCARIELQNALVASGWTGTFAGGGGYPCAGTCSAGICN